MKRLFILLFVLLLVAGVAIISDTGSVFAQDDNGDNGEPEFDPLTDNWCTNPDRWGDGRCNVEGDIWLTNWYYICGYYMARVESGEYPMGPAGQLVADGCLVELPPPPTVLIGDHGVSGAITIVCITTVFYIVIGTTSPSGQTVQLWSGVHTVSGKSPVTDENGSFDEHGHTWQLSTPDSSGTLLATLFAPAGVCDGFTT